jgi:hypothetical protein
VRHGILREEAAPRVVRVCGDAFRVHARGDVLVGEDPFVLQADFGLAAGADLQPRTPTRQTTKPGSKTSSWPCLQSPGSSQHRQCIASWCCSGNGPRNHRSAHTWPALLHGPTARGCVMHAPKPRPAKTSTTEASSHPPAEQPASTASEAWLMPALMRLWIMALSTW